MVVMQAHNGAVHDQNGQHGNAERGSGSSHFGSKGNSEWQTDKDAQKFF